MASASVSSGVICELLKGSILELCKASVPRAEGVEVDGIVCITLGKHTTEQLVVKIHEILWDNQLTPGYKSSTKSNGPSSQKVSENAQKSPVVSENFSVLQRPNKRKATCPVSIVNAKQACLDSDRPDSESSLDDQLGKNSDKTSEDVEETKNFIRIKTEVTEESEYTHNIASRTICIEPSEVYVCDVCKHCFSDHHSYTNHFLLSEKCQANFNVCSYCNMKLYDVKSYVLHLKSHSSETYGEIWKGRPVRCGVCTVLLRSKRSISDHMTSSHQHVKCYSCTSCDEIYPDFKTFRLHRNERHSSVNQCRCEMCDLFFTFTEYKDHEKECRIKIYTEGMGKMPEEYTTPVNSFLESPSADESSFTGYDTKIPSRFHASPSCENKDISISAENAVLDSPTVGPFRCQRCFLVFQDFEQYETHNHEMHSRYVCSYCAQSFATKRNLQRHARRHTGVRPYKCLDCHTTFTRDDDLKKHMFRHNHLTGYKGKSPARPQVCVADVESVGFNAESSNDGSVIIHQSQEPLYVQVNSGQDAANTKNETTPIDICENSGSFEKLDDNDISITIDDE